MWSPISIHPSSLLVGTTSIKGLDNRLWDEQQSPFSPPDPLVSLMSPLYLPPGTQAKLDLCMFLPLNMCIDLVLSRSLSEAELEITVVCKSFSWKVVPGNTKKGIRIEIGKEHCLSKTGGYASGDTLEASVENVVISLEKGGNGYLSTYTILWLKAASGVFIAGTFDLPCQRPTGLGKLEKFLRQRNVGAAGIGCQHLFLR